MLFILYSAIPHGKLTEEVPGINGAILMGKWKVKEYWRVRGGQCGRQRGVLCLVLVRQEELLLFPEDDLAV